MIYQLKITLLSDTTFGSGEGVAGLIDTEVEYDTHSGLPSVRGRTLRGLLVEECANLLYGLRESHSAHLDAARLSAKRLFGVPGSRTEDAGLLFVGQATLPGNLQQAVIAQVTGNKISPAEFLESLTTVRRQTAIGQDGVPVKNSLRTERAVLRSLTFTAELKLSEEPKGMDEQLLAACALCLRRGGLGRNRGRGKLATELMGSGAVIKPTLLFPEGAI